MPLDAFERIEQLQYSYAPSLLRWFHVARLRAACSECNVKGDDVVRFLSSGEGPASVPPHFMLYLAGLWCLPCVRFGNNLPGGKAQERQGTEQALHFLKAASQVCNNQGKELIKILCALTDCYFNLDDTDNALMTLTQVLYHPLDAEVKSWLLPLIAKIGVRSDSHLPILEGMAVSPSSHYAVAAWKHGGYEVFMKKRGRDGRWRAVGETLCRDFMMHHVLLGEFEDDLIAIREELMLQVESEEAWLAVFSFMFQGLLTGWVMPRLAEPTPAPPVPEATPFEVAKYLMHDPPNYQLLAALECTTADPFEKFTKGDLMRSLVAEFKERATVLRPADTRGASSDMLLKNFYDANPFPVWFNIGSEGLPTYTSYKHYLRDYLPKQMGQKLDWSEKTEKVLIAGCGSGHQMAIALHQYKNSVVTGIDLSGVNLAYAEYRLSKLYSNDRYKLIEKAIEDCTPDDDGLFDVVECCGVLHHCDDPEKALRSLKKLLRPNGVLLLGVYAASSTEKVRGCIKYLRDTYPKYGEYRTPDLEAIRSMRADIKELSPSHAVRRVLESQSSYFAAPSFRDMLFHPRAQYYSLPELRELTTSVGFSLLSLSFDACSSDIAARLKYSGLNPSDEGMSSWATWIKVEQLGIMQSLPWHNLLLKNE
eukprot:TRINITY_DN16855_c0_g1_i1.p1 TRINITY_DN16855_c0_g1~~TRINITY_DN16855_c0_g1_i1.p1  ORF type:complete len:649 (+),score=181.04 TRINITY_DN16855_c0_g1_i1:47-1993(+)